MLSSVSKFTLAPSVSSVGTLPYSSKTATGFSFNENTVIIGKKLQMTLNKPKTTKTRSMKVPPKTERSAKDVGVKLSFIKPSPSDI